MKKTLPRRITIVGGGFSGASVAVQLVRRSPEPLAITVIEPRDPVGPGLAYATHDPDHRLNGPTWIHSIDPLDGGHFTRWCERHGVFAADPHAMQPSGMAFVRRSVLGAYLEDMVRTHATWASTGSTIRTLQDRAIGARSRDDGRIATATESGQTVVSDLLLLATGNAEPRLQAPLDPALARHPGVIENPLNTTRLLAIPRHARVLLIGGGLTSLDVIATLRRQGHAGQTVVISRRGLRPRPQPPATGPVAPPTARQNLDRILGPAPAFMAQAEPSLRAWVKALRARIREARAGGESWYPPFDELRDSVWQLWPTLPAAQKRRFLLRLRTWYDVHRFRSPPQTEAICRAAQDSGQVVHRAARLLSLAPLQADGSQLRAELKGAGDTQAHTEIFDVVVNCTGLDVASRTASNPLLQALVHQGWLRPDDCGIGYAVDRQCRLLGTDGPPRANVRLIGPPTLGTFGDPGGALFIAVQIHRILPDLLRSLGIEIEARAPRSEKQIAYP